MKNLAYEEDIKNMGEMIEFLPEENCTLFDEAVSNILSENVLTEWLKSLMSNDQVFDQVAGTAGLERLRQLYRF